MPSKKKTESTTHNPAGPSKKSPANDPAETALMREHADALLQEGLLIRYAGVLRRLRLQGPVNFIDPPPPVAPVEQVKELVPKYLKKAPEGWVVTKEGYVKEIQGLGLLAMGRYINSQKEDLGVFRFEKTAQGGRIVFDF